MRPFLGHRFCKVQNHTEAKPLLASEMSESDQDFLACFVTVQSYALACGRTLEILVSLPFRELVEQIRRDRAGFLGELRGVPCMGEVAAKQKKSSVS